MTAIPLASAPTRDRSVLVGWALLGLLALFMIGASAAPKFLAPEMAQGIMTGLGWPDAPIRLIGTMEVLFTLLVLWPRTAPLGAVLMTGLYGGAIVTNLHAGAPMASHTLFSIYLGVWMWAGVVLRDARLRAFLPWR